MGEVLVTHGGVVRHLWEVLGRPEVAALATMLNSWVGNRPELGFAAGEMLGSGATVPGPAWASARGELYPSWAEGPVPFSQGTGTPRCARGRRAG